MKVLQTLSFFLLSVGLILCNSEDANAQQYKMRQSTKMTGMETETTIYVKGPRKRTEGGGYMGMGANLVTIEQCDLQRFIKINTKKKLYFIEPFSQEDETEELIKPAAKPKAAPASAKEKIKGGTIYTYYNITDTGERKKMYGFTARRIWTTQKIKPSADACMMKDSMTIKTDGWYIDLPEFNCNVMGNGRSMSGGNGLKPDCQDRFVSKRTGKGKLGFPLKETRTMIMGGHKTTEFSTALETLELTTVKLDSMLFEIPLGYQLASSEDELQDNAMDMAQMLRQPASQATSLEKLPVDENKKAGNIRIGVYQPKASEELQLDELQTVLVNSLTDGNVDAVAISSEEDAKKYNCDYLLNVEFTKIKQGSKVGSFLKAIKNTDPSASSSFNIEAQLMLTDASNGSTKLDKKVAGKFDGKVNEAAMQALQKGSGMVLKTL